MPTLNVVYIFLYIFIAQGCWCGKEKGNLFLTKEDLEACGNMVNFGQFHEHAKRVMDPKAYRYVQTGAGEKLTQENSFNTFRSIRIHPSMLRDVSNRILSTTLLGQKVRFPVGAAPAAAQMNAHPDGENATARAFARAGAVMVTSLFSTVSMEAVAAASNGGIIWHHLQMLADRNYTLDLVKRIEATNYRALVVTVDLPVIGIRYDNMGDNYHFPCGASWATIDKYENVPLLDPTATWEDLLWLKRHTSLPIVVKGVLTGKDALLAIQNGADAILVSNHGGAFLDSSVAAIEALPEVVRAVAGRAEVYMDSGIRSGMDVFKALALGARAVFVGRAVMWGLTYKGEIGVKCMLDILRNELDNTMALTGHQDVNNIPSTAVRFSAH